MASSSLSASAADSSGLTKHGFLRGYRFVPDNLEVFTQKKNLEVFGLLHDRIHGRTLLLLVAAVFHDLRILDHHPQDLYEAYKEYVEKRVHLLLQPEGVPAARCRRGPGGKGAAASADGQRRWVEALGWWQALDEAAQLRLRREDGHHVVLRVGAT
uniref:Uncharacterized protein n=1 Tax=Arundo donax TaxID=35708 RepID=A0A0A9GQI6_ARUDO